MNQLPKKFKEKLLVDVSLADYTRMQVGGQAKFLLEAKNLNEIIEAIKICRQNQLSFILIGAGSNIIFSDKGFDGLVIVNQADNISFLAKNYVLADAGVLNKQLVLAAAGRCLGGLEFLAAIPGTLGGAIYGNAGAYGSFISDFIEKLTILNVNNEIKIVSVSWLKPRYRLTVLKETSRLNRQASPILLAVKLKLVSNNTENILKKINDLEKIRKTRQPNLKYRVSGSIFKNPAGRPSGPKEKEEFIKKTAAYLLDTAGAKKLRVGNARVAKENANWIVNTGGKTTATDIYNLVNEMGNSVLAEHGVVLEPEIEFVGDF